VPAALWGVLLLEQLLCRGRPVGGWWGRGLEVSPVSRIAACTRRMSHHQHIKTRMSEHENPLRPAAPTHTRQVTPPTKTKHTCRAKCRSPVRPAPPPRPSPPTCQIALPPPHTNTDLPDRPPPHHITYNKYTPVEPNAGALCPPPHTHTPTRSLPLHTHL
jgi:hypothetical protein